MAIVRLAPVLRACVGGVKQVQAQGSTLAEVLSDLYTSYPELQERIAPDGHLSRFLNIYVNEQDSRRLEGLRTPVGPSDTIVLLPAMAGGAACAQHTLCLVELRDKRLPSLICSPIACSACVRVAGADYLRDGRSLLFLIRKDA
ncbi:MAG TPA: MoaD/ThiS family protein [Ktedonobacteraceae bacterium]